MLFEPPPRFRGLPAGAFQVFSIADRDARRAAIVEGFHPALRDLGEDLQERLAAPGGEERPLHLHLPRLDWPRSYQPFSTWLALSRDPQGYQSGPQLNVGVHADYVAVRLGWDTSSDLFGRFEFLCLHGHLGSVLRDVAAEQRLHFRVYASAAWPQGSRLVFESAEEVSGSFAAADRRGVWWELGRRWDLPQSLDFVCSAELGAEALQILRALLPVYDRLVGDAT